MRHHDGSPGAGAGGPRDPYDALGDALVRAAATPEPRRARLARWVSGHALVAIVGGTLITATATAAVVTGLRGAPSAPLSGPTVEPATAPGTSPGRYRIAFSPLAVTGSVGWCTTVTVLGADPDQRSGAGGCEPAPVGPELVAASSFVGTGEDGPSMAFMVVDRRVAGVRLAGGHVVLSRREASVPAAWRVIVVRSGDPAHGEIFDNVDMARWRLVGVGGRPLGPASTYEAANASRRAKGQPTREIAGEFPADAPCRIRRTTAEGWPSAPGGTRRTALRDPPRAVPGARGRPFLGCAGLTTGRPLTGGLGAQVLLDAVRPGARPAPLPGMEGPDDGSVVEVAFNPADGGRGDAIPTAVAQRRGNAWLVVWGGDDRSRRALIARLAVDVTLDASQERGAG